MSAKNTSSVIAWGGKPVENLASDVSFTDVMSEDLAKNLQIKEDLSQWPELAGEDVKSQACGSTPVQETVSDEMLAQLLQLQFDQEYDRALGKEEAKYNGTSKVGVSLSNYRKIPKGSLLDEDSDSFDDDEWDKAHPDWDSFESAEKESPTISKLGYAKKGGEIITKHDTVITGRKNACKAMELEQLKIGDGGGFDMMLSNKVYNNLKAFSHQEQKRAARLNDKHEKATATMAIDPRSRLILFRLVDNNILERINGVISTGKEAVILHAEGGKSEEVIVPGECAIKVFKTTLNEFKTRDKYIAEDYRFKNRFSKQNPRKIIHMWAEKEYHNLARMRQVGLPCPDVVLLKKHILVMSFIGQGGRPAPKLREAALSAAEVDLAYSQTVSLLHKMFNECHLVHADLSEYNILWHEKQCWLIDVSQAVEPSHPHGLEFLYRDCTNVSNFFRRLGAKDAASPTELFASVSGFSVDGLEADVLSQIRDYERNEEHLTVSHPNQKLYPFDYCWQKSQEARGQQEELRQEEGSPEEEQENL
ncbi:serine/threonine-protein kinase RIO3 [Daphnia magna]|uniref:serine/threonine-protein kinase RIO3 n=1 Tax=Daphnia magna TaxID=35525 RepID=UPI001E1BC431|nr:serine/threonine-protein kinase RIO3 [Daphnia magna]